MSEPNRSRPWVWVLGVLAASLAGYAAQRIGRQPDEGEAVKAIDSMTASIEHLAEQKKFGADDGPIELQAVTASAKGDMGVVELLTKQFINDAAAQYNEYLKALENAGWMSVLDAERLKKDPTMMESRAIVAASQAVVKEYREKSLTLLASLPERAKQATFQSEEVRRGFLKGVASSSVVTLKNNEQNWNHEEAIVADYAAVIELLARLQGHYQFGEDGGLVFETDEAVEIYNGHMTKANELIAAQAESMKQQQSSALKKMDEARDSVAGR
ncbi:MAG TPA: hypothetical protein VIU34_10380 [Steroidobacter sp.]